MITEERKDYVIRCWNLCERQKRIRMVAEFFQIEEVQSLENELVAIPREKTVVIT